jgi:hypothetical protein
MKLRPSKAADPIVRVIGAIVTDRLPPRCHALAEFFGKCRKRCLVYTERAPVNKSGGNKWLPLLALARRSAGWSFFGSGGQVF